MLILSDVDVDSAISLAEHFVSTSPPPFDVIVLCGPLSHHDITSPEMDAIATGDMASVIAHLENIVCRVLYVPSDQDPVRAATEQLNLTPNSVNLHARSLPLSSRLCISGFTERAADLNDASPQNIQRFAESEDEDEDAAGMQLQSSSCATAVQQVLSSSADCCFPDTQASATSEAGSSSRGSAPCGVFVFNYKFAHSLNHFLFFQSDVAREACLRLLVIPSFVDSNFEFPKTHSGYSIVAPRSLRLLGGYCTAQLELQGGVWTATSVQDHCTDGK